jgi:hypothetical protein
LVRKVRHVCDGGLRDARGIRRETSPSEISMPSLSSSPWMHGAPHNGWPAQLGGRGRAYGGRRERQVQTRRKAERCQRTTVAGLTSTRTSRQRDQAHATAPPRRAGRSKRGEGEGAGAEEWQAAAEGEILEGERAAGSERGSGYGKYGQQEREHRGDLSVRATLRPPKKHQRSSVDRILANDRSFSPC